jgi:Uma2 family endonuclease
MSIVLRTPMTVEAFLAWEERQALRFEFDGFQPVAMVGVTLAHSTIQANLIMALGSRLRGGPCRVHGSDLKIRAADSIRYPDVFVRCGPASATATVVADPVVVCEILSPSTSTTDHSVKNAEYRATPSIRRYVMLEQSKQAATVFERQGDDWVGHLHISDIDLVMPEIGVSVPLAELYDGVDFPPEDSPG